MNPQTNNLKTSKLKASLNEVDQPLPDLSFPFKLVANQLSKVDLIANDLFLGDGTTPSIIALSSNATDFTGGLQALTLSGSDATDDITVSLDGNFLNVQALSGGAAGRYNLYYKIESSLNLLTFKLTNYTIIYFTQKEIRK
mgnify:CR=1 FL=1